MSLRLRLLAAVAAIVLLALAGAGFATYSAFSSYLTGQLDSRLDSAAGSIAPCLGAGGRLTVSLVEESAPGVFAEVRTRGGRVLGTVPAVDEQQVGSRLARPVLADRPAGLDSLSRPARRSGPTSDDCSTAGALSELSGASASEVRGAAQTSKREAIYLTTRAASRSRPSYRVRLSLLADGKVLVLGLPVTETGDTRERLLAIELGVSGAALLLALGLGVLLVRLGTRPLVEVEQTAEAIMEGDLSARVPERFGPATEMGRLTRVLNSMLGRLSADFEHRDEVEESLRRSEARMRQFLADASHELRTPLSAISAYAELYSRGANRRPEDLSRILEGIRRESGRMADLVADLMLLANLDEGRPLEHRPVELVSVCADAVHVAEATGPSWPVAFTATEPVEVLGDETRLRQVVDNLLSNVRAHTPPGTRSTLRVFREDGEAVVELADHGLGLGEARRRVFERFFRGDASRTRESGGAGLGLAIVQAIVHAHGGSVDVLETEGGGATFRVRLPL